MKNLTRAIIYVVLVFLFFAGLAPALADESQEHIYEPYPAVSNDLLRQYNPDYRSFIGVQIADKLVYFKQRTIEQAIVQKDYILYHFDKNTRELLDIKMHWRDDLPYKLPRIISKEKAQSIVDGQIRFSKLFYISPQSEVFPIKPTPMNPCWVMETLNESRINVTVIDAVEGKIAGFGIPPPSHNAFSLSGPQESNPCDGTWNAWYRNARDWFNTMGYSTEAVMWPMEDKVRSHIQSHLTVMFYELAHGGSTSFENGCDDSTTAGEISSWLVDYHKMPFAFIGSCGGMCNTGAGSLSYAFRKGSDRATVTVGYCGMADQRCEDCWYGYAIDWQTALFRYMNQGWAVKTAFDQANAEYPACGLNACMRFAGDETFALVPVVERREAGIIQSAINAAVDGDIIIVPEGTYYENLIDFKGKNLMVRSKDPEDGAIVAATVINGGGQAPVITFSHGEDESCVLSGFTITGGIDGIYCSGASPTIINCNVVGNEAAGIEARNLSMPTITGCVIAGNGGDGIELALGRWITSYATITNCTIVGNAGYGVYSGVPTIINSIIYDNNGVEGAGEIEGSYCTITYSDVQGEWDGLGNIDADPCFVDAAGGDYHLRPDSQCINAGDPNYVAGPNDTDIDGESRVMLGRVDMGADEFNPFKVEFNVVEKRRIGRTVFEYDCEVTLENISRFAVKNIQLTLAEASENMTIIEPNVTFGDIEVGLGESARSIDTCTFSVDRSQAIDPAKIIWHSTCEMADTGQTIEQTASSLFSLGAEDIPGDLVVDGQVDFADLAKLAGRWLWQGPEGSIPEDIVEDGAVNLADFAELAEKWRK